MERTLLIIKPDGVSAGRTGAILSTVEEEGFRILALQKRTLLRHEAEAFYEVHQGKSFFDGLMEFMCSGPVILCVLEHETAVSKLRALVGPTDPAEAEAGSIRQLYGTTIRKNAVHASDSTENGEHEIGFFFSTRDLLQS